MASDGVRSDGRRLLLAEELALLSIGEDGGPFPGGPMLEGAYAAAILMELRARGAVDIVCGSVRSLDGCPTGDRLLDEIVRDVRTARSRPVRQEIAAIARTGIGRAVVERLERDELIARRRSTVLGLVPVWRYSVIPPRMVTHWAIRLHAIVRGEDAPDAREHALLPLLAAVHLLPRLVGRGQRLTATALAGSLAQDDPIVDALHAHLAVLEAGEEALLVTTAL